MRRWKCVKTENNQNLTVGKIYGTDNKGLGLINDDGRVHATTVPIWNYSFSDFEEVFEREDFTKSDLEEGDIVILRNGERAVYFDGYIMNKKYGLDISSYKNEMIGTNGIDKQGDIMEVYRNKQLIYKREEKSASQLKVEELEKTIAKAMEQIDEIKKENGYDN